MIPAVQKRLDAFPSGGERYAGWVTTLLDAVRRVMAETEADGGVQSPEKWRLIMDLSKAGANAFWALARDYQGSSGGRAELMRLATAHARLHDALLASYVPRVRMRSAGDASLLMAEFASGGVMTRELLTERAKADVAELMGDMLLLPSSRAEMLIDRIPAGVVAWQ